MTCVNPRNQMIYQMLLNKAASYPDYQYEPTAYKWAAESVRTHSDDLRYNNNLGDIPYIGRNIAKCIMDFNDHPCSISFCSTCEKASPVATSTASAAVMKAIIDSPPGTYLTAQQITNIVKSQFDKVQPSKPTLRRSERIKAKPLVKYA